MSNQPVTNDNFLRECSIAVRFLERPDEDSFTDLFNTFKPHLVSFFRRNGCEQTLAEDLAQDVMLTVYRKASQIRDRALFRFWLFKISRNRLCRHYRRQNREGDTINLENRADRLAETLSKTAGTPAFEFRRWMEFLDPREREVMILRFVEDWEYHEIASALKIPIGTVQWRVFNCKKKLTPYLTTGPDTLKKVA